MAKAISIEPSGDFDGYDGNWGTFSIQVGTPPQQVKVLPATSGRSTYLVSPTLCKNAEATCIIDRGSAFNRTRSNTWHEGSIRGTSGTDWSPENDIYTTGNGPFASSIVFTTSGLDRLVLGQPGKETMAINETFVTINGPIAQPDSRVVFGGPYTGITVIALNESNRRAYLMCKGFLGLAAHSADMEAHVHENNIQSSLLALAKETGKISSLSYGYNAGASYRKSQGEYRPSLTLGGYDKSRISSAGASFPINNSTSTDLLLELKSIIVQDDEVRNNGASKRMDASPHIFASMNIPDGVGGMRKPVAIRSDIAYMSLPPFACEIIASYLQLVYDPVLNIYLFDGEYKELGLSNRTGSILFTFRAEDDPEVSFTIPYAAFDLAFDLDFSTNAPTNKTRYFPMRQASYDKDAIGILGRVFLQEIYLVVDYERQNFTLHEARFDKERDIVAIEPVSPKSVKRLSQSLKIVLPVILFIIFALASFAGYKLWKRRKNHKVHPENSIESSIEYSNFEKAELSGTDARQEDCCQLGGLELDSKLWVELPGCDAGQPQLLDGTGLTTEMDAGIAAHEAPTSASSSVALDDRDQPPALWRSFSFESISNESKRNPSREYVRH